jgi:hypothetical protein
MPYNPQDPDAFRQILKRLSKEQRLSSQMLINLVCADRATKLKQDQKALPRFDISRNAVDRFKQGESIRNISGLREMYRVLESHDECSYCFPPPLDQTLTEMTFQHAFSRFFSGGGQHSTYDLTVIGAKLIGTYIMYRPSWWPRSQPGFAQASLMEISATSGHFTISETQKFPATKAAASYQQHDTGAIASFAKFIYFMMREDAPGTAVKFGLVTLVFPNNRDALVNIFRGILFTSSTSSIFPLSKFFCRRIEVSQTIDSCSIKITDIPDDEAKSYLSESLKLPQ